MAKDSGQTEAGRKSRHHLDFGLDSMPFARSRVGAGHRGPSRNERKIEAKALVPMPPSSLPWNCPNPYCEEPHNPSSMPVNGVVRCHSCGWERKVAARDPENLDDFPGLFTLLEAPKKEGE